MGIDTEGVDLRMLSLLHAMNDREGFVEEARRLRASLDESLWRRICDMGKELGVVLVDQENVPGQEDGDYDRDRSSRRIQIRRSGIDRRQPRRRAAEVIWLGTERRGVQRRQQVRRHSDMTGVS